MGVPLARIDNAPDVTTELRLAIRNLRPRSLKLLNHSVEPRVMTRSVRLNLRMGVGPVVVSSPAEGLRLSRPCNEDSGGCVWYPASPSSPI